MDSKTVASSYSQEDESAPPSYTDTISSYHPTSSSSTSQYYSSQIQSQLHTLANQVSSIQTQRSILSNAQDEQILSLLTHHIQLYLSDFANTGLSRGSLILVPAAGIDDPKAVPTDYDFSDADEYDRVVKVSNKEAGKQLWYWNDEDMAKRVATYLRPERDSRTLELPKRKEQVQPQSQTKGWGLWGKKKLAEIVPLPTVRADVRPNTDTKIPAREAEDRVVVDVKAEEVVFRTENEYGMYGSESGWGIVLKLRVVLGRK